jgi:type VI secretion system secreted protein Hcp
MPTPIYVWFEGNNQGAIEGWGSWAGEDDQEGREGSSLVQQFDHEIQMPTDPQSGQASGRRLHRPVRMVKRIDKATPKLYQALCSGERLKVSFKWFRTDPTGAGGQVHYFTTELEDAQVVTMKDWFPLTADDQKKNYNHFEDIQMTYRKIIWTWEDGGVQAEDDWKAG